MHGRFVCYGWGVLLYTIFVVLWGAYVRATGSGAGCGSHWPLCNGEVVPQVSHTTTLIEFGHRLTSGLALLLVVGLVVWAVRAFPRGSLVRLSAWWALFFMLTESLIGAGLVLFELVADNSSTYRAIWMALHLVNTFLLLIPLVLTPWLAARGGVWQWGRPGLLAWGLGVALMGVLWLGASGAVTALGNTLFPAVSLSEGLRQDFSPTAHVLIRLRVLHPVIALVVGFYLFALMQHIQHHYNALAVRRLAWLVTLVLATQLVLGALNVVLMAPIWLQQMHLLLANALWVSLVLLCAEVLARPVAQSSELRQGHAAQPG
jgi:heme A synthase